MFHITFIIVEIECRSIVGQVLYVKKTLHLDWMTLHNITYVITADKDWTVVTGDQLNEYGKEEWDALLKHRYIVFARYRIL